MLLATFYTPGAQSTSVLDKLPYSKYNRIVVERLKWTSGTNPKLWNDSSLTDAKIQSAVNNIHAAGALAELEIFTQEGENALNAIFGTSALRAQLVANIMAKVNQFSFDAVNLDFEADYLWDPDPTTLDNCGLFCVQLKQALGSKLLTWCAGDVAVTLPANIINSCDSFYIMSYKSTLASLKSSVTSWTALPKDKTFVGTLFGSANPWKVYRSFMTAAASKDDSAVSPYIYLGRNSHVALAQWAAAQGYQGLMTYSMQYDTYDNVEISLLKGIYDGLGWDYNSGSNGGGSPATGILNVDVTPSDAVISIGGYPVDSGESYSLEPGTYNWTISRSGYITQTGTIKITAGQTSTLSKNLQEEPIVGIQFNPGENRSPKVNGIAVYPDGVNFEFELWIGPNKDTKTATSDKLSFVSTGEEQPLTCPITMPTAPGKYKPFGRLTINGQEYGAFVGVDDIYIAGVTFNPNVSWS